MNRSWLRVVIIVSLAAAVGFGLWLVGRDDESGGAQEAAPVQSSTAQLSSRDLVALGESLDRPFYWAGPRDGVSYEFTETADRKIFVRYLPTGVAAGSAEPYLTVASYPVANAYAVTRTAAGRPGSVRLSGKRGGIAFYSKERPTNVYIAFPRGNTQVELYAPEPRVLRQLVAAGRIRPVSPAALSDASTEPNAAWPRAERTSPAELKRLASELGHPIFWLGRIPQTTLELSRSANGRVYLRYLPAGVAVGSSKPHLTVVTYPLEGAVAATRQTAQQQGAVRIALPGGAVAFYTTALPTNVYAAVPGSDTQVEVFDPSAGRAHELVAADRIQPVP